MADENASWAGVRIYTIGHSTLPLEELIARLRSFDVSVLADVRTVPRSRHNPQFASDALERELPASGIRYAHLSRLGGLRHARKDAPESAWRNASFKGYAAYMLTSEFEAGLGELRALCASGTVAVMCAEAVPWRCHRSLVADVLTARGANVADIGGVGRATPHRMTPFARVDGGRVTYPPEEDVLDVTAPFHLEATVRVLQRRPTNRVDVWDDGRYLRVLDTPAGHVLVQVEDRGTVGAPELRFTVRGGTPTAEDRAVLVGSLRRVLGLDVDPGPLRRAAEAEPGLRPVAVALRGMRPPRFPGLFETFANVIPFQQVSLDSGVAAVGRLVERFGEVLESDGRVFRAFPAAVRVAEAPIEALRECGLTARKAEALRGLAHAIASGSLSEEAIATMSTDDALSALDALPGIGRWSACLVLLRGLGRLDVFPPGDVGVARGLRALMHAGPEVSLEPVVERFGPARGYLYFLSLGGSLLGKGLVTPASGDARPGAE